MKHENAVTYHQCHEAASAYFYNQVHMNNFYADKIFMVHRKICKRGDFEGYGLEKVYNKIILCIHEKFSTAQIITTLFSANHINFLIDIPSIGFIIECNIYDNIVKFIASFINERQDSLYKGYLRDIINSLCKDITVGSHVPVSFVFSTPRGPSDFFKRLDCPHWENIQDNYPSCQQQINWLINEGEESKLGSLMIWTGIPGTGKTYALRSLMDGWRKTRFIIVIDPEQFMSNTDCLISTILEDESDFMGRKYACIVLEDAPDFILTESRSTKGDLISKMLNLTSGLLGQGLHLKILVTSNEDIQEIDRAFLRPGRLLQRIQYPMFTIDEAIKWLKNNNIHSKILDNYESHEISLANLYSIKNGQKIIDDNINSDGLGFKGNK